MWSMNLKIVCPNQPKPVTVCVLNTLHKYGYLSMTVTYHSHNNFLPIKGLSKLPTFKSIDQIISYILFCFGKHCYQAAKWPLQSISLYS